MAGALVINCGVSLRPFNTRGDGGHANTVRSGVRSRRYQGHCLEPVLFRQPRDSRREEESHYCPC